MEQQYPNLTPVLHRREGYAGWIDGVTKIESLFTGNTAVPWQYRVYLPDGTRKVAPEEDLEPQLSAQEFPPKELLARYVNSFEGESQLHALGYNLSDLNPEQRERLLFFCALPILGPERVVRSLCDILWRKVRRNKEDNFHRYQNAIEQWSRDLDFVLGQESVDLEKISTDTLNYLLVVKDHLEKYAHVTTRISSQEIGSILSKRPAKK
ncbi:MAG TPA: hypothetical protein VLJ10_02125 [Candidatus Bathyarchaeia archaeon]|nr:hypothetical protein [Candidatus Bathyarchaeia archaeon]